MDATPSRHAWTGVGGMDEPDTFEERALLARMSGNPAWLDPDDDDGDDTDVYVDLGDPVAATEGRG
jgi:hypothetical protein